MVLKKEQLKALLKELKEGLKSIYGSRLSSLCFNKPVNSLKLPANIFQKIDTKLVQTNLSALPDALRKKATLLVSAA